MTIIVELIDTSCHHAPPNLLQHVSPLPTLTQQPIPSTHSICTGSLPPNIKDESELARNQTSPPLQMVPVTVMGEARANPRWSSTGLCDDILNVIQRSSVMDMHVASEEAQHLHNCLYELMN